MTQATHPQSSGEAMDFIIEAVNSNATLSSENARVLEAALQEIVDEAPIGSEYSTCVYCGGHRCRPGCLLELARTTLTHGEGK